MSRVQCSPERCAASIEPAEGIQKREGRGSDSGSDTGVPCEPEAYDHARQFGPQAALVFLLYATQGVPAGFVDNFLPLVLYSEGAGLHNVGLVGMLSAPWLLKVLWAPLVDRYGSKKDWVLPTHVIMLVSCLLCAAEGGAGTGGQISSRLTLMLLLFVSATGVEDCAVDGYAMQLLNAVKTHNRGTDANASRTLALLNSAQVVGFKLGHFYAGAPVWYVHYHYGWSVTWAFLAAPILLSLLLSMAFMPNHKTSPHRAAADASTAVPPSSPSPRSKKPDGTYRTHLRVLASSIAGTVADPHMLKLMLAAGMYKMGEKVVMPMYKPYLVDQGISAQTVGYWVGTYGTVASGVGSVVGAILVDRLPIFRATQVVMALRCFAFVLSVSCPLQQLSILLQGLGSGLVTPVMFAYFMTSVAHTRHPVTSYTLLQTCDDTSRVLGYAVSGYAVESLGYRGAFGVACASLMLPSFLI